MSRIAIVFQNAYPPRPGCATPARLGGRYSEFWCAVLDHTA